MGRIALGTLGRAVGGIVGGGPLFLLAFAVGGGIDGDGDQTASNIGVAAGLAGFATGMALGIWGVGSLLGGEGRYLPTLGGTVLGILVGVGTAVLLDTQAEESLAIPPLIAGPIMGAVIAYEISHSIEWERGAEASTGIAALPTVSVRLSGGFVAGSWAASEGDTGYYLGVV